MARQNEALFRRLFARKGFVSVGTMDARPFPRASRATLAEQPPVLRPGQIVIAGNDMDLAPCRRPQSQCLSRERHCSFRSHVLDDYKKSVA